jgi:ABC-2 type transport system permease protein
MSASATTLEPKVTERTLAYDDQRPPRTSVASALWSLYVLTLRQHLHGRRWMILAVLFLLPAGLAVFVRATAPDVPPVGMEFMFAFMFIPQGLLPLIALLYASGMIQDEQEEQTLTYLLIRPIPKWALYGVKWLATLTTATLLTALLTALTYIAIYAGSTGKGPIDVPMRCLKAASVHSLAVAAYCSLFGVMSLFTRRMLVMGIVYTAFFEGLLANLPLSIRLVTVIYYARIIAYRTIGFVVPLPRGMSEDIAAQVWRLDVANDPTLAEHPTLRGCVTVLICASLACTLIAAVLCARREFHVKTPEKG